MKNVIKIRFCQNLSKFQGRIEELRRETRRVGGNSQPLRQLGNGASLRKRRKVPSVGKFKRRSFKIKFFTNLLSFHFEPAIVQNQMTKRLVKNFILKERRLVFSSGALYRGLLETAPFTNWRCVYRLVRTMFQKV